MPSCQSSGVTNDGHSLQSFAVACMVPQNGAHYSLYHVSRLFSLSVCSSRSALHLRIPCVAYFFYHPPFVSIHRVAMAAQCATVMLRREVGNCDARRCSRQRNCAGKAQYNSNSRRAKTAVCENTFSLPLWVAQMRRSSLAAQGCSTVPGCHLSPGSMGRNLHRTVSDLLHVMIL